MDTDKLITSGEGIAAPEKGVVHCKDCFYFTAANVSQAGWKDGAAPLVYDCRCHLAPPFAKVSPDDFCSKGVLRHMRNYPITCSCCVYATCTEWRDKEDLPGKKVWRCHYYPSRPGEESIEHPETWETNFCAFGKPDLD